MPEVIIETTEVCFIDGNSPTSNQGNIQLDVGESNISSEKRRSLIEFDLSSIPSGSTINSASFKIYLASSSLSSNNRTIRVYRVKRDWVYNQATWNIYSTGNNWGTAGCSNTTSDRDATEIGSLAFSSSEAAGWKTFTLTTSLVQEWIDGTLDQNGLFMKSDTEVDDMQRFHGISFGSLYPNLVIDYTPPPSSMFLVM